jgi:hypothetical protein
MSERSTAMTSFWTRPLPIIAVALLFRLAWAAFVPVEPISDGILYDAFAKSIVAGQGYAFADGTMTEYWPVGTSAIYALFYLVFGQHPWVLPTFQAFLGAYIVYLTWRLAEHTFGAKVAAVAAWLTASWPLLIEFTTINASELLFIALVLMALNIWIPNRIPPTFRMILWGACIAAATYVRPTALPVVIAFPAIQWMIDRNGRALIRSVLISALTASLLFAPWSYRSLALFDRFVLVSGTARQAIFNRGGSRSFLWRRSGEIHSGAPAQICGPVNETRSYNFRSGNDRNRLESESAGCEISGHHPIDNETDIERLLVGAISRRNCRRCSRDASAKIPAVLACSCSPGVFFGVSHTDGCYGSLPRAH